MGESFAMVSLPSWTGFSLIPFTGMGPDFPVGCLQLRMYSLPFSAYMAQTLSTFDFGVAPPLPVLPGVAEAPSFGFDRFPPSLLMDRIRTVNTASSGVVLQAKN